MVDPWKDRCEGMRCNSCVFFVEKTGPIGPVIVKDKGSIGRCRRNAPTLKGFPVVWSTDWCGEHRLDENKLLIGPMVDGVHKNV